MLEELNLVYGSMQLRRAKVRVGSLVLHREARVDSLTTVRRAVNEKKSLHVHVDDDQATLQSLADVIQLPNPELKHLSTFKRQYVA